MRFIPTNTHGVIDLITAVALIFFPRISGFSDNVISLITMVGLGLMLLSLITRYEFGPIKLIPMVGHLGLDFVVGVLLIAAPFFLVTASTAEATMMIVVGIMEIALSLTTHITPTFGHESPAIRAIDHDTTDQQYR